MAADFSRKVNGPSGLITQRWDMGTSLQFTQLVLQGIRRAAALKLALHRRTYRPILEP